MIALVVLESFSRVGSCTLLDTLAVLVMKVPEAVPGGTWITSVKEALALFARLAAEHVTVPPAPTGGFEHENAGPEFCESETKVVVPGRASVRVASAVSGPALRTSIEYVMFVSASAPPGPDFVTDRSAPPTGPTSALVVLASFSEFGSNVALDTVALLVTKVPRVIVGETWTTSVKVVVPPFARVAAVHVTVPPAPTAGVEQVNAGPVCESETNVVPEGRGSVTVAFAAASGPTLRTSIE
jgi:hypothetical protein